MDPTQSSTAATSDAAEQMDKLSIMDPTQLSTAAASEQCLARMDKLSSEAYTSADPPTHWSDTVYLVPHEALRAEMDHLVNSSEALLDSTTEEQAWKAELFAKWIVDYLVPFIFLHHENEEKIYLPFMVSKGCNIPEEKIAADHDTLMKTLDDIGKTAQAIVEAKGMNCCSEIKNLKSMVGSFVKEMLEHLKEEEQTLPSEIKAKMTPEEHKALVGQIIAHGGIDGIQKELPAVQFYTKIWASDQFYSMFEDEMPPPILKLSNDVFMPNWINYWCAMRDAPTLDEKPGLERVPFDPSMLPPAPGAA